tara:strand:- start:860 stop:1087 length:228 start_codon:yes stop_codon:yes gene_type:complete
MPGRKKDKGITSDTIFNMNDFLALDPNRRRRAIQLAVRVHGVGKLNRENAGWAGFNKGGKISKYYKAGGNIITGR